MVVLIFFLSCIRDWRGLSNCKSQSGRNPKVRTWRFMYSCIVFFPFRAFPKRHSNFQSVSIHLSKVLRLPRKSEERSYEVLHLSRHAKQRMLQNATPSPEISTLTSEHLWWRCLLYCACHAKSIFADPLQTSHAWHHVWKCYKTHTFSSLLARCRIPCARNETWRLNVQNWSEHVVSSHFWLRHVLCAAAACTFPTAQLPKVVWQWPVLTILISKCA